MLLAIKSTRNLLMKDSSSFPPSTGREMNAFRGEGPAVHHIRRFQKCHISTLTGVYDKLGKSCRGDRGHSFSQKGFFLFFFFYWRCVNAFTSGEEGSGFVFRQKLNQVTDNDCFKDIKQKKKERKLFLSAVLNVYQFVPHVLGHGHT